MEESIVSASKTHLAPKQKPSRGTQYFATLAATTGVMAGTTVFGYTSPAIPRLLDPTAPADGSLTITQGQANWFSSSIMLALFIGALISGYGMKKLGRKPAILLTCIIFIISWVLVGAAQNFAMLMVGRVISGLCIGATTVVIPTYIGEIASADIRGMLGSGVQVVGSIGTLWSFTTAAFIPSWRWLTVPMAVPAVLCIILMIFVKESPLHLLSEGKDQQALAALQFFRGQSYDCGLEMEDMKQFLEETKQNKASVKDLLKPYNLKPFIICIFIFVFNQFSGIIPVTLNLYSIFQAAGTSISENMSSIIIGLVQLGASAVAALLMDRAGRKLLLIISASAMALSHAALGDFFYLKEQDSEWATETLGWLPLTSIITFIIATSIGFLTIQWVMLGELFSPEVREVAASIVMVPNSILGFIISLTFIPMQDAIGAYGVYWFYGGMCVLALIFSVLFVPETKGKTIHEISIYFGGPGAKEANVEQEVPSTLEM